MKDLLSIKNVPNIAYYIPDFLTKEDEDLLLLKIYQVPKPKWTYLSNRRLQNWGGLPHSKGMVQEKLPTWLEDCCHSVNEMKVFSDNKANHVLVNEYKPGQGIMPHKDGALYYPTVTTISLGCHTLLDFYKSNPDESEGVRKYVFSFLLERRSLLILKESLYTDYLHGIKETDLDQFNCVDVKNTSFLGDHALKKDLQALESMSLERKNARVSLTIRYVPKTIKFKFKT